MPDLSFLDDLPKEYKIIRDVVIPVSQGNNGNEFEFSAIVVGPYEISLIVSYDWKGEIENVGSSQWLLNKKTISSPMDFCDAAAHNVKNLLWDELKKDSVTTTYVYLPYISSIDSTNMQLATSPDELKEHLSVQLPNKKYSEKDIKNLFEYFNKFRKSGVINSEKVLKNAKIQNSPKPKQVEAVVEAVVLDTQQKPVQKPKKKKKKKKTNNKAANQMVADKKTKQQNISKSKPEKKQNDTPSVQKIKSVTSDKEPKITIGLIKPYAAYSDRKELVTVTKNKPIKTETTVKKSVKNVNASKASTNINKENKEIKVSTRQQNTKKDPSLGILIFLCFLIVLGLFVFGPIPIQDIIIRLARRLLPSGGR